MADGALKHCEVSCSGATLKRPLLSTAATGGGRYTKTETALTGTAPPPVITKAGGATLMDVDGNEYTDYVCGDGALQCWFLSSAHTDEQIDRTIDATRAAFRAVAE